MNASANGSPPATIAGASCSRNAARLNHSRSSTNGAAASTNTSYRVSSNTPNSAPIPARLAQSRATSSPDCSQTMPITSTPVSVCANSDAPLNSTNGENISSTATGPPTRASTPIRRIAATISAPSPAVSSGLASQAAWITRNGASSTGHAGGYCENHFPSRTYVHAISKISGAGGAGFQRRPCRSVRARNT